MSIDASIPLGFQPQRINTPFENLNVVLDSQHRQQQVRAGELEMQQAEREAADQQALRAIWQQHGKDPETAIRLTKERNPILGMKMESELMDHTIRAMDLDAKKMALDEAETDYHLSRLLSLPPGDDAQYQAWRTDALRADPGLARMIPPRRATPQDEAQIERAAESGKQSLGIITKRREELNKQRDDARLAADRAEAARHNQAMEGRQADAESRQAAAQSETARHNLAMEAIGRARANRPASSGNSTDAADAAAIADAIMRGEQPPELTGLYRMGGVVRATLARKGYNQAEGLTDWRATQKHVATLNGAQQTRMGQAIDNAAHSLDVIDDLATQWEGGRFPPLNRAQLALAKAGALGSQAQQIATKLDAQIADVTSELANVYMGGNSPTDHALTLAAKNLSADWSREQLRSMVAQSKKNLQIRANSMRNVGVAGASANNPYAAPPAAPEQSQPSTGMPSYQDYLRRKRGGR